MGPMRCDPGWCRCCAGGVCPGRGASRRRRPSRRPAAGGRQVARARRSRSGSARSGSSCRAASTRCAGRTCCARRRCSELRDGAGGDRLPRARAGGRDVDVARARSSMTMMSWTMGTRQRPRVRVRHRPCDPTNENVALPGRGLGRRVEDHQRRHVVDADLRLPRAPSASARVALDPANPSVRVGGHRRARATPARATSGMGAFRSTDGGATFQARNGSGPARSQLSYIQSIAVHPTEAGRRVLVSRRGLLRSGSTQARRAACSAPRTAAPPGRKVLSGSGGDVVLRPRQSRASSTPRVGGEPASTSRPTAASPGHAATLHQDGRLRLAMAPSNSQVLYALRLQLAASSAPPTARASWTLAELQRLRGPVHLQPHASTSTPPTPNRLLVGSIRFAVLHQRRRHA